MSWLDGLAINVLAPLAVWVFASSLDDVILDASYLWLWLRSRGSNAADSCAPPAVDPKARIAILIPCWDEADVIEDMIERNVAAIDYSNYEVWLGVYPNDEATRHRAAACSTRLPNVRYVVCPHDGPTTKADCLNAIYEGIRRYEQEAGKRYDVFLQHDAEDVIHTDSLRCIASAIQRFDMVQIPVFPLPLGPAALTHGTYGDFFAEFHLKELRQRAAFGGFVPSAGVGTAYRSDALDALWEHNGGRLFDEESLTEDYAIGLQLHALGRSQTFLHVTPRGWAGGRADAARRLPVATRAYFPKRVWQAIRQRSRWVTGIALQSWQKFGWRAGPGQLYWLWRDRKGLVGHPASLLANVVFAYGAMRWLWAEQAGATWYLGGLPAAQPALLVLLFANAGMIVWRQLVRGVFVGKVYGWKQALTVPIRAPWANAIDCCATLSALCTFLLARVRKTKLSWVKTAHAYPSRERRARRMPRLGEMLLARGGALGARRLRKALAGRLPGERIGAALLRDQSITEAELYRALSRQQEIPFLTLSPAAVEAQAANSLPHGLAEDLRIFPYRRDPLRRLWIATPEAPDAQTEAKIAEFTSAAPRFVLVTPSNYRSLQHSVRR
jgi:adsorption protein B